MQDVKLHDFENIDLIYSNYIIQHQNGNSIPFLSKNVIKQFWKQSFLSRYPHIEYARVLGKE